MSTHIKNSFLNNSFDAAYNEKQPITVYIEKKTNSNFLNIFNQNKNKNFKRNFGRSKVESLDLEFENKPRSSFLLSNINSILSTKLKKDDLDTISFANRKFMEKKHIFLNSLYGFKNSSLI